MAFYHWFIINNSLHFKTLYILYNKNSLINNTLSLTVNIAYQTFIGFSWHIYAYRKMIIEGKK